MARKDRRQEVAVINLEIEPAEPPREEVRWIDRTHPQGRSTTSVTDFLEKLDQV